jgi:hypothetical protein
VSLGAVGGAFARGELEISVCQPLRSDPVEHLMFAVTFFAVLGGTAGWCCEWLAAPRR